MEGVCVYMIAGSRVLLLGIRLNMLLTEYGRIRRRPTRLQRRITVDLDILLIIRRSKRTAQTVQPAVILMFSIVRKNVSIFITIASASAKASILEICCGVVQRSKIAVKRYQSCKK